MDTTGHDPGEQHSPTDERAGSADERAGSAEERSISESSTGGSDRSGPETTLPTETPPGPRGWPLVGNTIQVIRDPFGQYERLAEYGDVVSYDLAGMDFVALLHPDHVERVLVTESEAYRKTQFGDLGVDFASEGLIFSDGDQWRAQRTMLQDAFTLDRIQRYGESMADVSREHVAEWPTDEPIALNHHFSDLTLSILCRTLFDIDLGEREAVVKRMANALQDRSDVSNYSAFLPSWVPTPLQRRYDRAIADFESMVDDLIAERRAADDLEERDDLLSILMHAEGPDGYAHSDRELRDQLLSFLFAGHDTTSLALTYTSMLLAEHDDVLERIHAEWNDVLGDDDPDVTDLPQLEYTDRVLKESLRLYPPAYMQFREAARDTELGGYRIPEGTKLSLPQFSIHEDERFYDDPESFAPDRWTDGFEDELPEYAYFPFGGGPRHCIGMRFARTELKLVLPTVLRAVDLDLLSDPNPDIAPVATAQPEEDVRVSVSPRVE